MEKTKFLTLIIIVLLAVNAGTLAYLVYSNVKQNEPTPNQKGGPAAFIIKQLKLDEQQQTVFEELRFEHRSGMIRKQDSIRTLHQEMFNHLKSDTPNATAADSIATIISLRKKELDMFTFHHFRQLREICNAEQKQLFDKFINEIQQAITSPPHREGGKPPR